MARRVRMAHVVGTDDTPMPMLSPGGGRTHTARMSIYRGDDTQPCNVFAFTRSRKRDGPAGFLADYRQVLVADACGGYDGVVAGNQITRAGCWAHLRRKFVEAEAAAPALAREAVERVRQLYRIEQQASGADAGARLRLRPAAVRAPAGCAPPSPARLAVRTAAQASLRRRRQLVLRPLNSCRSAEEGTVGALAAEAPADFEMSAIERAIPGADLAAEPGEGRDAAVPQALAGEEADLDLGRVEPAAVVRGVMQSEAAPDAISVLPAEGPDQGRAGVGAQIVQHEVEGAGAGVAGGQVAQQTGELPARAVGSGPVKVPSAPGLDHAENVGGAAAAILIVPAGAATRLRWPRRNRVITQPHRLFVQTKYGFVGVERALVPLENVVHPAPVLLVQDGHAPDFFPATA